MSEDNNATDRSRWKRIQGQVTRQRRLTGKGKTPSMTITKKGNSSSGPTYSCNLFSKVIHQVNQKTLLPRKSLFPFQKLHDKIYSYIDHTIEQKQEKDPFNAY